MKAKDSRRYIDKEKTALKTANNLYKESLSDLSTTKRVHQEKGIEKATPFYSMIEDNLSEALLFGKGEAAGGLAYLHRGGLGVEKSEHNGKLFIAIGSKLGDLACKNIIAKGDYSDVDKEANSWVKAIKEIEKKYPNKDAEITTAMVVDARDVLKIMLPEDVIYSYDKIFKQETHYYIDKEHTILRTADDLYKDCMENLK